MKGEKKERKIGFGVVVTLQRKLWKKENEKMEEKRRLRRAFDWARNGLYSLVRKKRHSEYSIYHCKIFGYYENNKMNKTFFPLKNHIFLVVPNWREINHRVKKLKLIKDKQRQIYNLIPGILVLISFFFWVPFIARFGRTNAGMVTIFFSFAIFRLRVDWQWSTR